MRVLSEFSNPDEIYTVLSSEIDTFRVSEKQKQIMRQQLHDYYDQSKLWRRNMLYLYESWKIYRKPPPAPPPPPSNDQKETVQFYNPKLLDITNDVDAFVNKNHK